MNPKKGFNHDIGKIRITVQFKHEGKYDGFCSWSRNSSGYFMREARKISNFNHTLWSRPSSDYLKKNFSDQRKKDSNNFITNYNLKD